MRVSTALCRKQTLVNAVPISFDAPAIVNKNEENEKKKNIFYLSITSLFSFKSALNNNFEMSPNANNSETKRKQTNDHDHNYLYEIAYVLFLEFLQMI